MYRRESVQNMPLLASMAQGSAAAAWVSDAVLVVLGMTGQPIKAALSKEQ